MRRFLLATHFDTRPWADEEQDPAAHALPVPGANDGTSGTAAPLTGCTIVEADSMDAAKALTVGHPFLSEGKGDYAIDIYELMPVPEM